MSIEEFLEVVNDRVSERKEMMKKIVSVYVECNIEQAKMFSVQLSSTSEMSVIPLTISDLQKMDKNTIEVLTKCQVIITTFNHVNEVIELTKEQKKDVLGVAINPDLGTIVRIARYPEGTKFGFICISEEFMFKIRRALESSGLGNVNMKFTNTYKENELKNFIEDTDVIIVSPGRYKDIKNFNKYGKDVIEFIYTLDDGSVKAIKSKLIELKYNS